MKIVTEKVKSGGGGVVDNSLGGQEGLTFSEVSIDIIDKEKLKMTGKIRQRPIDLRAAELARPMGQVGKGSKRGGDRVQVTDVLAAITDRRKVMIEGRELPIDDGLIGEIEALMRVYTKLIAGGAKQLVAEGKANVQSSLLLTADGDHYETTGAAETKKYVHKPGWDLCCSSLLERQAPPELFAAIQSAYTNFRLTHPFLQDGVNFLPQRMDMAHFHLAVGREITAPIPQEGQQKIAKSNFVSNLQRVVPTINKPTVLVGGLFVSRDGVVMLKTFPLDGNIRELREQAEVFSLLIDSLFEDNNQGAGAAARKKQTFRINQVVLGRLTRPVTLDQFAQIVRYTEAEQGVLGYYQMQHAFVVIEDSSYFEHPTEITPVPFRLG
ncbi:hypothetical protein A2291_00640 [candidate division WOR-1 bacterium RIFOXYB2_FULL_42_35]|nr:MAG: hypothetical protein A2247_06915 [candidate division WOR-1 bacterium RIFOXYA2_FULL_41_14]OGC23476.1 MAG: hypothetical protein A2291_00640 [candidate division WOR-1 bacterium RIFOXYB2_FULL_42_35]OGC44119.1 MAG: hypothetical protein A2548_06635 [candidate division WOR-1 bacterium RIFOXYD2_FULL_41_8]